MEKEKSKNYNREPDTNPSAVTVAVCIAAEVALFLISAGFKVEIPIAIHIIIGGVLGVGGVNNIIGGSGKK